MAEPRVALISGSSSGIGLAATRRLLQQGYRVVGLSRRGRVEEFADADFIPVSLDFANPAELDAGLAELLAQHAFDCFIHAAGQGHFGSIEQFSVAQIVASIELNLTSALVICRGLVPQMRRRGQGQLLFIGSESALSAGRKGALYSAAKFGLRGFCQALREDCAADGIRVSLVNPGMVRSPFFEGLGFAPGDAAENAIDVDDVVRILLQILDSSSDIVIDEINLSPRVKSLNFKPSG